MAPIQISKYWTCFVRPTHTRAITDENRHQQRPRTCQNTECDNVNMNESLTGSAKSSAGLVIGYVGFGSICLISNLPEMATVGAGYLTNLVFRRY